MLFISSLILAISSSIDSIGLGITYGLKRTILTKQDKLILFFISAIVTLISGLIGNILKNILSEKFFNFIGSIILICIGLFIIFETNNKEYSFDFDNSNDIDCKEAIFLGLALSLDSLCIGIGAVSLGINIFFFSILVAFLQFLFLSIGNFLGINLSNFKFIPQSVWTKISGIALILIGALKL